LIFQTKKTKSRGRSAAVDRGSAHYLNDSFQQSTQNIFTRVKAKSNTLILTHVGHVKANKLPEHFTEVKVKIYIA
jgi:hypothetical protein